MAQLIRIDLSKQLGDGQYIEIRDPRKLPWGEQKKIQLAFQDQSVESQVALAEQLAISLAKNGNVFDEDGNPITFPLTRESLVKLPASAIDEIALEFAKLKKQQGDPLPKE